MSHVYRKGVASINQTAKKYLHDLSRGGLINSSTQLEEFVSSSFSSLEYANEFISNEVKVGIEESLLHEYARN